MQRYTANMQKGGAMIEDCLRLLKEWRPGQSREEFTQQIVAENLLGKSSRSRAHDLLSRIFFRRFGGETPDYLASLAAAGMPERDLALLFLYHTALADALFYDFIAIHLFGLYNAGRLYLDTADGVEFIQQLTQEGKIDPPWSEQITLKNSRGLLAACRDFGLLEGQNRKEFSHPHLSPPVFLYIAHSLAERGVAPGEIMHHRDWRLFLMEPDQVERLFLQAHQTGDLRYETAGGITRIEWTWHNLSGLIAHLIEGTH